MPLRYPRFTAPFCQSRGAAKRTTPEEAEWEEAERKCKKEQRDRHCEQAAALLHERLGEHFDHFIISSPWASGCSSTSTC
jgi:hypothetical protein